MWVTLVVMRELCPPGDSGKGSEVGCSASQILPTPYLFPPPHQSPPILRPIFKVGTQKAVQVKWLSHGHAAGKWQARAGRGWLWSAEKVRPGLTSPPETGVWPEMARGSMPAPCMGTCAHAHP